VADAPGLRFPVAGGGKIMPVYFSWKPSLSVFVEEIDNQHMELYRRLDRFLESVLQGEGKQEVNQILRFLIDYCVVHFGTEELYMQKHAYHGYSAHKKAHERLTNDVLNIQCQVEEGVTSQHIVALINQLGDWVTEHIEKMDKELGTYLRLCQQGSPTPFSTALGLHDSSALKGPLVNREESPCGHMAACSILFEKFRDPESSKFWRARYCRSLGCRDCERKRLMDQGTLSIDVPVTLLPDGQHLPSLAQYS
jgi:hemerythrin